MVIEFVIGIGMAFVFSKQLLVLGCNCFLLEISTAAFGFFMK